MAAHKLTPLQETEARRLAAEEARNNKTTVTRTDEEKAVRKSRVEKAKDALARSVGVKGDHVAGAPRCPEGLPPSPQRAEPA